MSARDSGPPTKLPLGSFVSAGPSWRGESSEGFSSFSQEGIAS
eukprot:CAMPEP_0205878896 /NCGR_PEP_ID=MMETSP1083-20121108/15108_1 /ASSEMBLY_ACC=CAM_ASM_000430 /TAXON_ID=97485 /ORGANISM="Prymnesium parvum, Strain Texoma1" /LENGTH=42 /DNA_ID= /DNA_START= /DNA_END= /DNA_ORIENTATION=